MRAMARKCQQGAGAKHRARLCLALVLAPALAWAGPVTVALDESEHVCGVHGYFTAPVSDTTAWHVLSDYDHIASFVSSMVSSRAERQSDGRLLVHQVASGDVLFMHPRVQVTLDIEEDLLRRIRFRDVMAKDFKTYTGEWEILADSMGTKVSYRLAAEPRGTLARAFCRRSLRHTAEELLEEVRAEMMKRAKSAR